MAEFYPPWDDRSGMWTPEIRAMERDLIETMRKANEMERKCKVEAPALVRAAIPLPWVR